MELFDRLADVLGQEATATLLELLPPAGQDVATKDDILRLEAAIASVDDRMDTRMSAFEERMDERMSAFEERIGMRMSAFEGENASRLDIFTADIKATIERRVADAVTAQTRVLVLSQLAALVAIAALAFGLD